MRGPRLARRVLSAAVPAVVLALTAWGAGAQGGATTSLPVLKDMREPLPAADTVKDPVFSILLGVLDAEQQGLLRGDRLDREVRRRGGSDRFLYNKIAWVSRQSVAPGTSEIRVRFRTAVQLPFPYSILGYHPGRVKSSESCRLREWHLGDVVMGSRQQSFKGVKLFALEEGSVFVDVDGWIDALAGAALDDAGLSGLALMRYGPRRYGVAYGYNREGKLRSGVLDFGQDKVLLPPPPELKGVVRDLVRRSWALTHPSQGPT